MLQVESTKNSFLALSNYLNKVEVILCQDLNLLLLFFGSNFSPLTHFGGKRGYTSANPLGLKLNPTTGTLIN